MGDLTKNFSWYEIAPKYNLSEIPDSVKTNLKKLALEVLQPARERLGIPLLITSGYRSLAHNQAVGGAKDSQHVKGTAVDIYCPSKTGLELYDFFVRNFSGKLGGIGIYANENIRGKFIHIDIRPKITGAITSWYFDGIIYREIKPEHKEIFIKYKVKNI